MRAMWRRYWFQCQKRLHHVRKCSWGRVMCGRISTNSRTRAITMIYMSTLHTENAAAVNGGPPAEP